MVVPVARPGSRSFRAGQEVAHGGPQFQLLVRAEEVHPAARLTALYYSKII
jgi:hypothetical protein